MTTMCASMSFGLDLISVLVVVILANGSLLELVDVGFCGACILNKLDDKRRGILVRLISCFVKIAPLPLCILLAHCKGSLLASPKVEGTLPVSKLSTLV